MNDDQPRRESRPTCWQCMRPSSHCHCNLIPPFLAQSNTIILQHPGERKRYYSTAKLITQWIHNCVLIRGVEFEKKQIFNFFPKTRLIVLFPSQNATSPKSMTLSSSTTVIVIDGTWSEAKKIYKNNQWLQNLPHIILSPTFHSRYRIRKQPESGCLSTIEALAYMFLENNTATEQQTKKYSSLLKGFDRMVDTHIQSIPVERRDYYDRL